MKLKAGLLSNASLCIRPLTFINGAFRLSGSLFVASTASPWFSLAGCYVNMATPIHLIDSKCHNYKVIKSRGSHKTCFTLPISHHWLLMPSGADTQTHTHTHTDMQTKAISRNLLCAAKGRMHLV